MVSDKDWHSVPVTHEKAWQAIFQSSHEILDLSASCPVCGRKSLHRWYHVGEPVNRMINGIRFIARGGVWEWCSSCRCFRHYSGLVPEWWSCNLNVDDDKLTVFPTAIEDAIQKRHL
jgi:hypothetical protein